MLLHRAWFAAITAQSGEDTVTVSKTLTFDLRPHVKAAEWMPYLIIGAALIFAVGAAVKKR